MFINKKEDFLKNSFEGRLYFSKIEDRIISLKKIAFEIKKLFWKVKIMNYYILYFLEESIILLKNNSENIFLTHYLEVLF